MSVLDHPDGLTVPEAPAETPSNKAGCIRTPGKTKNGGT